MIRRQTQAVLSQRQRAFNHVLPQNKALYGIPSASEPQNEYLLKAAIRYLCSWKPQLADFGGGVRVSRR